MKVLPDTRVRAAFEHGAVRRVDDDQIADVIDHERSSWGNSAPTVTANNVAAVRAKK
jgi:hypothetical protein